MALSKTQLDRYFADGFLMVDGLFDPAATRSFGQAFPAEMPVGTGQPGRVQIHPPGQRHGLRRISRIDLRFHLAEPARCRM